MTAAAFIPVLMWVARRFDILDHPEPPLKKHLNPIPYLGGPAVMAGLAAGLAVYPGAPPPELLGMVFGAAIMMCLGLADDLNPISPYVKLAFQVLATTVMILGGLHVSIQAFPPVLNYLLTYVWMMAMTNAFNIIDVHDGLCSGTALVICAGLILVSVFTPFFDKTFVTVTAAAAAGGVAAFFVVNHPPARMFLGDAGSLPIGFLLSGLAIGESYTLDHMIGLLVPFMLFVLPLYDLIFVVVIRLAKGLSPIRGSPDHVAIRLRSLGWGDSRVLWSLMILSAAAAALSPGVVFFPLPYAAFLGTVALATGVGIGVVLARIK